MPDAPTGLRTVAVSDTVVELYWTAPSNTGGAPITSYKADWSADGEEWVAANLGTLTSTGRKNTFLSQTGLSAGTTRHYRVLAVNAIGDGLLSGTASATTTHAPVAGANQAVVPAPAPGSDAITTTSINLQWPRPSSAGASTRYIIEYTEKEDSMDPPVAQLPWKELTRSVTALQYTDHGLTSRTTRHYRVSMLDGSVKGPASAPVRAMTTGGTDPGAPTGLRAVAVSDTVVELYWTAPGNTGGAPITDYKVDWSTDGETWDTADTKSVGGDDPFLSVTSTDETDLSAGDTWHYRVSAMNNAGTGEPSTTARATTTYAAVAGTNQPRNVMARANGPGEINLTWGKASGAAQYIIEYTEEIDDTGASELPWMEVATVGDVNKYSDTGLDPVTLRHYRVSGMFNGVRGPASATADAITDPATAGDRAAETTPEGVPDAPTGLRAVAVSATVIEIYWTAPENTGGAPITDYTVEQSANGTSDWTALTRTASDDTHQADTVTGAGTTRHYRVLAVNAIGNGLLSETANATTPVGGTQPGMPAGVTATADGSSMINLLWTKPTNPGKYPITSYIIEYTEEENTADPPVAQLPWKELAEVSTSSIYTDSGLDPVTKRHYRVSAVNAAGRGPVSTALANATTGVGHGVPDQPGEVSLSTMSPVVGAAITAMLEDPDGTVSGESWQWEKSRDMTDWMDATGTGAMTAMYTPDATDNGYYLRATVMYTDGHAPNKEAMSAATTSMVVTDQILAKFDKNPKNGQIDFQEVLDGIDAYFATPATATFEEVLDLIDAYLG